LASLLPHASAKSQVPFWSFQKGRKLQKLGRVSPVGRQSLNLQKGCQKGRELFEALREGQYLLTDVAISKRFFRRLLERLLKALWKGHAEPKNSEKWYSDFTKQMTVLMSEK
jgi:hypothetical protein